MNRHLSSYFRSRGISFEIPLDGDLSGLSGEGSSHRGGMTRSASSDGLGFKVHYATRGVGLRRHQSLVPVAVNGQKDSRHIAEEEEDYGSQKPLGRNNTFSIKNQSRYRSLCGTPNVGVFISMKQKPSFLKDILAVLLFDFIYPMC